MISAAANPNDVPNAFPLVLMLSCSDVDGANLTPTFDTLASKHAVVLTSHHAQPLCTPTRTAFLTGKCEEGEGGWWWWGWWSKESSGFYGDGAAGGRHGGIRAVLEPTTCNIIIIIIIIISLADRVGVSCVEQTR
jgi:hypothetical protein